MLTVRLMKQITGMDTPMDTLYHAKRGERDFAYLLCYVPMPQQNIDAWHVR